MRLRYLLAVAAGKTPAPLLCFLHGYGEAAPHAIERALRLHGPLAPSAAAIAKREFIIVAPQLPTAGDLWARHADDVRGLVAGICVKHAVEAARMYLTGFSFGGNGVFDLGLAQPDLWAALWAVDPTRVPRKAPAQPLWLSAGEVARAQKHEFRRALRMARSAFTAGCCSVCASAPPWASRLARADHFLGSLPAGGLHWPGK